MASQEGTSASGGTSARVEPVLFLNTEVKQESGSWLGTLEICIAVCNVVADESVAEGAQRIGGLWRIYLTDEEARVNLLCTGISLRGQQITLRDKNPFLHAGLEGADTTRLFVRNIPLSFDNAEIEKSLKSRGVQMIGSLKYARARTAAGKLTNFKTGDRFVDIIVPKKPLPQKLAMGLFTASLYHKEQKQGQAEIECGNCKQKGHMRRDCKNEAVCYDCLQTGHKKVAESVLRCKKGLDRQSRLKGMMMMMILWMLLRVRRGQMVIEAVKVDQSVTKMMKRMYRVKILKVSKVMKDHRHLLKKK